tara:strand:- start:1204 stop:1785 length:582 start_codon:yes stop_codon:yes gene_type:complete
MTTTLTSIILGIGLLLVPAPMGLDWERSLKRPPTLQGYKLNSGNIKSGILIYFGIEEFLQMETEIQLSLTSENKISKALLIFGPEGISEFNCLSRYRKIKKHLTKKYGKHNYEIQEKSSIIDDLLYISDCYALKTGLLRIKSYWRAKDYIINATLLGDDHGLYIEILYSSIKAAKKYNKKQNEKILKKLSKEL